MTDTATVSLGLAFVAGLASFLSPCVLPLVPSYVTFVTGMTLEDLTTQGRTSARRHAAVHAALFVLGFTLVFVTLGATATALGATLRRSLPLIQQVGGIVIVLFGLYMLGVLRLPGLMRERRVQLASKPAGRFGSVLVGMAFGAGWTPCVGPVLASILLYAGMKTTMAKGMLLLGVYGLGLGVPFFVAAVALNWYLAGAQRMRRWLRPIEMVSGALLVVVGVLLFTGRFTLLSNFFASFGSFSNPGL
ncbi:MAG TPA: cytochrome c biogenesis protein CcdA [Gemmatimonadaceae bacterium]|nr:cytochrome c biogenesis protein CcdA [Gemmatimonadaceae bacterium]